MTESHSPVETALDLFVYAPVGLALTAAEEIPKLAAKGRSRLTQQLTMAKMVGQFAVTQGRKELNRRFAPPARPAPTPPAAAPSDRDVTYERLLGDEERAGGSAPAPSESAAAPATSATPATPATNGAVSDGPTADDGPGVDSLAIPGYDSLAASQVVQRLAGLSQDELEAVGAYEAGHRNRRTILSRVRQLQAG